MFYAFYLLLSFGTSTAIGAESLQEDIFGRQAEIAGAIPLRTRWPSCKIPYVIDPMVTAEQRLNITAAFQAWHIASCCRFIPRNMETAFLTLRPAAPDAPCAVVQLIGDTKVVDIAPFCDTGDLIPLLGEVIGLTGEQKRVDAKIHLDFLPPATSNPLYNADPNSVAVGPYDYDSIMHAPAVATTGASASVMFRSPRRVGQRIAPSRGDKASVEFLYGAPVTGGGGGCAASDILRCANNWGDFKTEETVLRVTRGTQFSYAAAAAGGVPPYIISFSAAGAITPRGADTARVGVAAPAGMWPMAATGSIAATVDGDGTLEALVRDSSGSAACITRVRMVVVDVAVCFNKTGTAACGGPQRGACKGTAPFMCECNAGFAGAECEYDVRCDGAAAAAAAATTAMGVPATAGAAGGVGSFGARFDFDKTPTSDPRVRPFTTNTSTAYGVTWLGGSGLPLSPKACSGGGCMLIAEGHGLEVVPFGSVAVASLTVRWRCLATAPVDACGVELHPASAATLPQAIVSAQVVVDASQQMSMQLNGVGGNPASVLATGVFTTFELTIARDGSQLLASVSATSEGREVWKIKSVPLAIPRSAMASAASQAQAGMVSHVRIYGPSSGQPGSSIYDFVEVLCGSPGGLTTSTITPASLAPRFTTTPTSLPPSPATIPLMPLYNTRPQPPFAFPPPSPPTSPPTPLGVAYKINVTASPSQCRVACSEFEAQLAASVLKRAVIDAARESITVTATSGCVLCGEAPPPAAASATVPAGGSSIVAGGWPRKRRAHVVTTTEDYHRARLPSEGTHGSGFAVRDASVAQLDRKYIAVQMEVVCEAEHVCESACATVRHTIQSGDTHTGLDYSATAICRKVTVNPDDPFGTPVKTTSNEWSTIVAILLPLMVLLAVSFVAAMATLFVRTTKPHLLPDNFDEFGPRTMQLPPSTLESQSVAAATLATVPAGDLLPPPPPALAWGGGGAVGGVVSATSAPNDWRSRVRSTKAAAQRMLRRKPEGRAGAERASETRLSSIRGSPNGGRGNAATIERLGAALHRSPSEMTVGQAALTTPPRDILYDTPSTRFASEWDPRARTRRMLSGRDSDATRRAYVHTEPRDGSFSPLNAILQTPTPPARW